MDQKVRATAEKLLGYSFEAPDLLQRALTHASITDQRLESNERLEFLGDAILGMIVCDYLFERYPDLHEGDLTKIKSAAVSRRSCALITRKLGLHEYLRLGKGMSNRPDLPDSLAAAVFESIIAAIYLDGGFDAARQFVLEHLEPVIDSAEQSGHQHNFKSILQQYSQQAFGRSASYLPLDENGPDHAKCFKVCVEIGDQRFPSQWASSKKQAEQGAALNALLALGIAQRNTETDDVFVADEFTDLNGRRTNNSNGSGSPLSTIASTDDSAPDPCEEPVDDDDLGSEVLDEDTVTTSRQDESSLTFFNPDEVA